MIHARPRRRRTAPTIRALAVLVLLALALVLAVTALHGHVTRSGSERVPPRVQVLGSRVVRPAAEGTTTSTTTVPAVAPVVAATPAPPVTPTVPTMKATCADALEYLAAHQAPGFVDTCADGSALGHLGYTCANVDGRCAGRRFIRIACPAPFVYMNEAHNSWVVIGERSGIDPYGQGTDAERAACARHR